MFPLLCQILKDLCYSPGCCSVYQGLVQTSLTTALGTIQIMVGLSNIGLGPGRTSLGAAYWLGAVFVVTGIMSILAGEFPSSCLMGFTVFMNIAGAIFAITGIVLYAIDLGNASLLWMCDRSMNSVDLYDDNCRNVALFAQSLLTSMDITLIVFAVLQLCVNIWFAVLGIKALISEMKKEERLLMAVDITLIVLAVLQLCVSISVAFLGMRALDSFGKEKGGKDADFYQPALKEEVFMISPRV